MNKFLEVKHRWFTLFLISSISLFMELAVIRWLSAEIRILAYYKNLVLLGAFLGLSIGFVLVGKKRDMRPSFPLLWGFFILLAICFSLASAGRNLVYPSFEDEFLWHTEPLSFLPSLLFFIGTVLIFFLTSMFLFIPLGQMVGEEMTKYKPVQAYIVNILASLVGVWAFSLVSFLRTPPIIWFGLALLGIAVYYKLQSNISRYAILVFVISLIGIGIIDRGKIWSPYNRLNIVPGFWQGNDGEQIEVGYTLDVQQTFYQTALNLNPKNIKKINQSAGHGIGKYLQDWAEAYNLPYKLVPPESRVLVVGSGMGNNVAAALRARMGQIDAVDIDPVILDLGLKYHPEHPYSDPKVMALEADARSFFNNSSGEYDLIVFGLLDSHTLLSSLSSVRLDSFVYTIDSFNQVKNLLKENGYVSITFAANEWIKERLGRMMALVYGPDRVYVHESISGTTFIAGDFSTKQISSFGLSPWLPNPASEDIPLTTDDWPYLYLRAQKIPGGYWQTLLVIVVVCLALFSRSFPEALQPDWHFWFLGAAFLLIEFKSITELALLFGTTWFVNSLAISGVLMMALAANLFVLNHQKINLHLVYSLLFTSIIISFIIPISIFANMPSALKAILSTLLLSLPLFFAGIIFSESLRRAGNTAGPLASNFCGSAVGGIFEYGSILWGIKSLYIVALVLYSAAFIASQKTRFFYFSLIPKVNK